jgi:hypothetical protein
MLKWFYELIIWQKLELLWRLVLYIGAAVWQQALCAPSLGLHDFMAAQWLPA